MYRFNRSFQKSNENTTCELYTEITRLTRIYAVNICTEEAVRKAGDKIYLIDLDKSENLKPYESLNIGDDTWVCVSQLEQEMDMNPFFSSVREFYLAMLKKMFKKFPFKDTILLDFNQIKLNPTCGNW